MHRIALTQALGFKNHQRAYKGILETNASGSWVASTSNVIPVIARWVTLGKSISEIPSQSLITGLETLLQVDDVDRTYSQPDILDVNMNGITTLQLRPVTLAFIVNMQTGAVVTPSSVTYTDTETRVAVTGLTGYHRFFLIPRYTKAYTAADLSSGVLRIPGLYMVYSDIQTELAAITWTNLWYKDGDTYIDFGTGYTGSGTLLIGRGYSFETEYATTALMIKFGCEVPMFVGSVETDKRILNQSATRYMTNGFTHITGLDFQNRFVFTVPLWAFKMLNPTVDIKYAQTQISVGSYSITQESLLDAVRSVHTHVNLLSLDKLQVLDGTLYVDGVPINPSAISTAVTEVLAAIAAFDPDNHVHEMDQINGLTAALAARALSDHTHPMSKVDGLVTALSGKAASDHTHAISKIDGLNAVLTALSSSLSSHTQAISRVTGLQEALDNKLDTISVTELPSSPIAGYTYKLTKEDNVNKASPGLYMDTGVSWLCIMQNYAYDLGEIDGTLDLPNIINVIYTAKVVGSLSVNLPTFTNIGNIILRLEDAGSFVVTWSSNIKWADASLPILSEDAYDWLVFASSDGYDWNGTLQIKNVEIVTREMTSTWVTTDPNTTVTLPFVSAGIYNCAVDWGDGTITHVHAYDDDGVNHIYAVAGTYTITITGIASHWSFNNTGTSKNLIKAVTNLGALGWRNFNGGFYGCTNLESVTGGDVSQVTDMTNMFRSTIFEGATFAVSTWDTSKVTSMRSMFRNSTGTPDDVSGWDTGAVTDMSYMFYGNADATPDVSGWDMHSVITIEAMFQDATLANPDTAVWVVTALTTVANAFRNCTAMITTVTAASFWENVAITSYANCFTGAINISNYADIPNGWKGL